MSNRELRLTHLDVYDTKGTDRLLGHLEFDRAAYGRRLEVALWEPLRMAPGPIDRPPPVRLPRTVTFDFVTRNEQGIALAILELRTDAPLSDLLAIPKFWLPGETPNEHRHRLEVQRWGR